MWISPNEYSEGSEEQDWGNRNHLTESKIPVNRLLVIIWTLKEQLVKEEKEKKNMLIENWRKENLCNIVAEWLAELCPSGMWRAELENGEIVH